MSTSTPPPDPNATPTAEAPVDEGFDHRAAFVALAVTLGLDEEKQAALRAFLYGDPAAEEDDIKWVDLIMLLQEWLRRDLTSQERLVIRAAFYRNRGITPEDAVRAIGAEAEVGLAPRGSKGPR